MRLFLIINFILLTKAFGYGQMIGEYEVQDFLNSAIHPVCSEGTNDFILGRPNNSAWANISNGIEFEGFFNARWNDNEGNDLVIESGFDADRYDIELILADSSYSMIYTNEIEDWVRLDTVNWNFISEIMACGIGDFESNRQILPLDFNTNFGLQPDDEVIGIRITFGFSDESDIAGAYIVAPSITSSINENKKEPQYVFYPNPVYDEISFHSHSNSPFQLKLFDLKGQLLAEYSKVRNFCTIPLSDLPKGLYLIEINSNDFIKTEKIFRL